MRGWLGLMTLVLVAPAAAADPACEVAMGPLCATFPDDADDVREATEAALCSLAPCPGACDPGDYEGCGVQPEVPLPTDVATLCGLVLPTCHVDCGPPWPPEPKVEDRRIECRPGESEAHPALEAMVVPSERVFYNPCHSWLYSGLCCVVLCPISDATRTVCGLAPCSSIPGIPDVVGPLRQLARALVCPHLSDNLLPVLCHWS